MPVSNTIPIVVVTDEHYVTLLAVLLKSIEVNHTSGEKVHFYIIEDKVKQKSQQKIQALLNPAIFSITWIKMEDAVPKDFELPLDHTSFPLTTYMRLFIPYVIPANVNRVLFLDVDMMVLEDISKLWNQDIGDHVIAAVQDPVVLTFNNDWGGVLNYKELGFAPDTKYFNSGLYILNVQKWIAQNLTQRILDSIKQHIKYANYADQYGLNITLANQWCELDPRWNYFASGDLDKPYIVHFTSRKPIYKSYNNNSSYKQLFDNYLKLTPWQNAKPVSELNRYFKKLNNILVKVTKIVL